MKKIEFLAVETDLHKNEDKGILQSARINNINLKILGRGENWQGFFSTKWRILRDYLPTTDSEIVCITDSRDVYYFSDEETIYKTFLDKFSKDMVVFSGETNCDPDKKLAPFHPNQDKKYKYLNAGQVIGNRKLLIELVDRCSELYKECQIDHDQYLFQKILIEGNYNDKLKLDYNCEIFQCIWDQDFGRSNNFDLIYTKDEIYNRLTDTYPLIFHYPGQTCTGSQVWKILNKKYYKIVNTNKFIE
jgi:hypothetical protein